MTIHWICDFTCQISDTDSFGLSGSFSDFVTMELRVMGKQMKLKGSHFLVRLFLRLLTGRPPDSHHSSCCESSMWHFLGPNYI